MSFDEIEPLTWRSAEHLAVEHMLSLGFLDAARTRDGADGGLDVLAADAAAQVKLHAKSTGAPDVQRLRGAAFGKAHVLFYSRGYTSAALEAARATGVALFVFDDARVVIPLNAAATQLAANGVSYAAMLELLIAARTQTLRYEAWSIAIKQVLAEVKVETDWIREALPLIEARGIETFQQGDLQFEELKRRYALIEPFDSSSAWIGAKFREVGMLLQKARVSINYSAEHRWAGLSSALETLGTLSSLQNEIRAAAEASYPRLVLLAQAALEELRESDEMLEAVFLREHGVSAVL